jgi:hypothetical protein
MCGRCSPLLTTNQNTRITEIKPKTPRSGSPTSPKALLVVAVGASTGQSEMTVKGDCPEPAWSCVDEKEKLVGLNDVGFRMLQGAPMGNKPVFRSILNQGHKLTRAFWVEVSPRDDTD